MKSVFTGIVLLSIVFSQPYIDIVELKNGDIIKGKIIENIINDHIRIELVGGSILTYQYSQIESLKVERQSTMTFGSDNQVMSPIQDNSPVQDCYNDGYASGQSASPGVPMLGGFVAGVMLGPIGWGISYAVVTVGNPQPSQYELKCIEGPCAIEYRQCYKDGALKAKKTYVNIGGALETLALVSMILATGDVAL